MLPVLPMARGIWPIRKRCMLRSRMPTFAIAVFLRCSSSVSPNVSNRRVRTRTHGGVAGVGGQPPPLCRSNAVFMPGLTEALEPDFPAIDRFADERERLERAQVLLARIREHGIWREGPELPVEDEGRQVAAEDDG